jgi:hypothetical protein
MPRKIKYKAIYRDPGQNPFKPRGISIPTKTVEIDDDVPREQVEAWAREAQESYVFDRLEVVG